MKTLINFTLAAIVLNAVAHCGLVARNYFMFQDAAQQVVLFGAESSLAEIEERIRGRAAQYDVPLPDDGLHVRRDGARTVADAVYTDQVEVFPNFRYPVVLSFTVEAQALATGNARPAAGLKH
jgi:hypothetical protein